MGKYTIEKGIPIPTGYNITDGIHEALSTMEIGDSILFKTSDWKRVRNVAYRHNPKTFTFRAQKNGYCCWRIT